MPVIGCLAIGFEVLLKTDNRKPALGWEIMRLGSVESFRNGL